MSAFPSEGAIRPSLAGRFWIYQSERFPLGTYGPLVAVFTFSAAAYSRMQRGVDGFIPWPLYLTGVLTSLALFFWLRVLDEHKDRESDRQYRPELPVPRGLVSLAELRRIGVAALGAAVIVNAVLSPPLLWALLLVAAWAALMTREFFVREWLRRRPTAYLLSHMLILPMIDAYTTGLDWLVAGEHPRQGLWLFLLVTFLNGCLIEIGRKIRAPDMERGGVDTYTSAWGVRHAPLVWLAVLLATGVCTWAAAAAIGAGQAALLLLPAMLLAAYPAAWFVREPKQQSAQALDAASGAWTLLVYLFLGAGPFLVRAAA